ncbi:DoxX family membrane protein [Fredinandcohnia sp. 179-A 10B2 NHS]|uniref:DoxX family membrane protein n=1 Tax=Fredinandcohnia sp. 179-A 10B2 NHS TaxID=3235176 RepID=UPI0039A27BBC
MKKVALHVPRVFLGVLFLVAGVNGFFVIFGLDPFIATSPEAMSLFDFSYLLVAEKSLEVFCGLLLLSNRYVPLALAILAPLVVNIFLLHLFEDQSLLLLAVVIIIAHGILLVFYRNNFKSIFEKRP